ncbi:MAG: glycosyltransferase family 4 protein [Hydrogenophilaceae bacterium]
MQILPALESGGVERGTLEVGRYLVEHGHRSIVISAGGRLVEQLLREGSEHVQWDIGRKSLSTLRLIPRLRRFLRDNKVDILHARSRLPAWIGYLAWKGMDPRTRPHFVTTVHGIYSINSYSAIMVRGEVVIAVSDTVRRYILSNYPRCDPARIRVIPRGVAPTEYLFGQQPPEAWLTAWNDQYPELQGKRLLTLPGRITRLKGHMDFLRLIDACRRDGLPVHGLIVGGADPRKAGYLEELKTAAQALGIAQDITFTGQRGDLKNILAISDIVFSLSNQPEAFGRTVLEALSLGIPVAGYGHGGVGELLEQLLPEGGVAVGDVTALTRLTKRWLSKPPVLTGMHAFTLENMLAATLAVYCDICRKT